MGNGHTLERTVSQEIFFVASALAAWTSLSLGVLSFYLATRSYRRAFYEEQTRLYLELRRRYLDMRKNLSPRYFDDTQVPVDTDSEWYSAEQYWYQAFDEWFATNKLNNAVHGDLWDLYFGPAVQSTLKARPMREVARRMTEGRVSFGTYRDEFHDVLVELWKNLKLEKPDLTDEKWDLAASADRRTTLN